MASYIPQLESTYTRTVLFRKHTTLPVHTAVCQDVKKNTKIKDADLGPQNSPRCCPGAGNQSKDNVTMTS